MLLYLIGVIIVGAILNSGEKSNSYAYIAGMTVLLIFVTISLIIIPERLREKEILKIGEVKQLSSEDSTIIQNLNGSPQNSPSIKENLDILEVCPNQSKNIIIFKEEIPTKEEKVV